MRLPFFAIIALMISSATYAENLYLYVFFGERPVRNADVMLDGEAIGKTDQQGALIAPLTAGEHRIVVGRSEIELANFTFTNSAEQNAEITITADGIEEAKVEIELVAISGDSENAPGFLKGFVLNDADQPVADAVIYVPEVDLDAISDENGQFEIELSSGVYSVEATDAENRQAFAKDLRIVSNVGTAVELRLLSKEDTEQNPDIENVVVLGTYKPNTTFSTVTLERESFAVTDAIDIGEISRFGDSSVAAAVRRVVGVALDDGKYAIIRGLDGRYISSTLNGNSLPTTDPLRRDVQLDLFPASILQGIEVQKSYTADQPGDTTAGSIKMITRSLPDEKIKKFSISTGGQSGVVGSDVISYEGGDTDFIGIDDGTRDAPSETGDVADLVPQLSTSNAVENTTANPDIGLSYAQGNRYESDNGEWGYYTAIDYKNAWTARLNGRENDTEGDFTFERSQQNIDLSAYLAVGKESSEGNELLSKTILLRKTDNTTDREIGVDDEGVSIDEVTFRWTERQLISQQFVGKYNFDNEHVLDWRVTLSQTSLYEPDRRTYQYRNDTLAPSTFERRFSELTEDNSEFGFDYLIPWQVTESITSEVKLGTLFNLRSRDFEQDRFGLRTGSPAPDLTQDINDLVNNDVFNSGGLRYRISTDNTDQYQGESDTTAIYLHSNTELSDTTSLSIGIRSENNTQELSYPNSPANNGPALETDEILPSLALTHRLNDSWQLRAAYGKTISRPNFVERSDTRVFDPETNRVIIGNPALTESLIDNIDFRVEYYFSDEESLSIALFNKEIDNPIERGIPDGSGSAANGITYRNNDSANVIGLEFDINKNLEFSDNYSGFIAGNIAVTDSEIVLSEDSARFELDDSRQLQGLSPLVVNMQLGIDHLPSEQKFTVLLNYLDDRIDEVGRNLANRIEEARLQIDLTYEKLFGENKVLTAKIKNLLSENVEFSRDGLGIVESYDQDVEFSIGFSMDL